LVPPAQLDLLDLLARKECLAHPAAQPAQQARKVLQEPLASRVLAYWDQLVLQECQAIPVVQLVLLV
jgi:hypothetical protein